MMKKLQSFKKYALHEKKTIPPAVKKKYGEVLFGTFRKKKEKDTFSEDVIFRNLLAWIVDNQITVKITKSFKELQTHKEVFKDILVPETTTIYRGTVVPAKLLANVKPSKNSITKAPSKYRGHRTIQSWTSKENIAWSFAAEGENASIKKPNLNSIVSDVLNYMADDPFSDYMTIPVVLKYTAKDKKDIIFNSAFMAKMSKSSHVNQAEFEVVRIGKNPIDVEMLIPSKIVEAIAAVYDLKKNMRKIIKQMKTQGADVIKSDGHLILRPEGSQQSIEIHSDYMEDVFEILLVDVILNPRTKRIPKSADLYFQPDEGNKLRPLGKISLTSS